MKPISSRTQFKLVAIGYAAVLVFAAAALYGRHLLALRDPGAASGGMAAFGDTLLYIFLGCLFLIPTAFLIWTIAKSEALYTTYSRFLFGVSLSAPICLTGLLLGEKYVALSLGWLCLFRILESPIVLVGMGMSRFGARFDRSKRLVSYALLVEGLTLGLSVAAFVGAIFI